jgi:lysophospholipase L1-like esterase
MDDNVFTPYPQVVLFGDSITAASATTMQSWLQQRYIRRADVVNRGFSGYTVVDGLSMLTQLFPSVITHGMPKIKVVTLFFGANDACCSIEEPDIPQVSLEVYSKALSSIINYTGFASQGTQIVLISPPPVDEYRLPHRRLTAERTAKYASEVRHLAQEYRLPFVDCWTVFLKHAGWSGDSSSFPLPGDKKAPRNEVLESLLSDGIHLTAKGYELLFHELVQVLSREVPEAVLESLPLVCCKQNWFYSSVVTKVI